MLILVANLGSTSFKYKLYRMPDERLIAEGAADRIGQGASNWSVEVEGAADGKIKGVAELDDHAAAIGLHLEKLVELGAIDSVDAVEAIGFKAVHGGPISGAVPVTDDVIATMKSLYPLAPAHNPPYVSAMEGFRESLPGVKQVAAFETAFHASIPLKRQAYGVPYEWIEAHGIRRYGFHGASNAYIATRMAQIAPDCKKIINLHLGGSCSICAIQDGKSAAHSMGSTPQTGLFHANRVGDFDPYAVLALKQAGMAEEDVFRGLGKNGGLLGLSGVSADCREVCDAAAQGHERAQLAVDAFVEACRHYLGAYLAVLNGADAVVFTAGIGQHDAGLREQILAGMDYAGIQLDLDKNQAAPGSQETRIDAGAGAVQVWVVPTNEELIVARQTFDVLN